MKKEHQHFIPRTYIKRFNEDSNSKIIHVYDKMTSQYKGNISVSNICVEKNFYTLKNVDEEKKLILEDFFSREIEDKYPRVFDLLIKKRVVEISLLDKVDILKTTLSMYFRTPKKLNQLIEILNNYIQEIEKSNSNTGVINFFGYEIKIDSKINNNIKKDLKEKIRVDYLSLQVDLFEKFVRFKIEDGLTVLINKANYKFFTSDNPVNFSDRHGISLDLFSFNNSTYIPLDSDNCLFIAPKQIEVNKSLVYYQEDNFMLVHVVNAWTFENAERWVIGDEKYLKNSIDKVMEFSSTYDDNHPIIVTSKIKSLLISGVLENAKKGINRQNKELLSSLDKVKRWDGYESHIDLKQMVEQFEGKLGVI